MSRLCEACQHPDREQVDLALLTHGASYETIAAHFGLSYSGVRRHQRTCLGLTLQQSKEIQAMLSANNLLAKLGEWHQRMEAQYANADAAGEIQAAVSTARVGIQAIESFHRITADQVIERKLDEIEARVNAMNGGS
jgi:AraC-like DNA-binding protein